MATKKTERIMPYNDQGTTSTWYDIPDIQDERCLYVNIPCGQCIECRRNKAREWQVRLYEELMTYKYGYFLTLTFSPEQLDLLCKKTKQAESNYIAGYAVRHFLERWRKEYKKSIKHWMITELGHENTERIHLHGLIFTNEKISKEDLERIWKYGQIWCGDYCNAKTINYIVKYVTKIDEDHKNFVGQIFASPGIGKKWIERHKNDITYTYKPGNTRSDYVLNNGQRVAIPKYYRNHLYNEEEREKIWRDFMDEEKISISSIEHSLKLPGKTLENITRKAKENNQFYGYGNDSKEWKKAPHNITERMLKSQKRMNFEKIVQKNLHI